MSEFGEVKPKFDCAIFADTQEEPEEVYKHLEWLKTFSIPIVIDSRGKIGDDLINGANVRGSNRRRFASIPAFTLFEGKRGRVKRQCTSNYKIEVIERALRRQVLKMPYYSHIKSNVKIHFYFGISEDEKSRASKIYENSLESKWSEVHFPLMDRKMTRQDCKDWLAKQSIPHEVPRSACVFCPFHTDSEWLRIKEKEPKSWERALEIDRAIRSKTTVFEQGLYGELYLHASCKPLDEIDFDKTKKNEISFESECEGMCGN